jgi:hypothetical protein
MDHAQHREAGGYAFNFSFFVGYYATHIGVFHNLAR